MHYVKKLDAPQSFINKTASLNHWDDYHNCCKRQKRALRKYILKHEQNNLCIYCESKISSNNNSSHIEHIRPKALNRYPELTFEYTNLVVSCNGNCHNDENNYRDTCGHIKENMYKENKFLNPVEIINIREYFDYNLNNYLIIPSSKDTNKAQYMINTLHLNDGGLPKARKKALEVFINKMKTIIDTEERKQKIKLILIKENISFISFLKYKYSMV